MSEAPAVRVILCDDHMVFAQALAAVLEHRGYEIVDVLDDPHKLVDLLREDVADICVLDLGFPDADGIDITAQIVAVNAHIRIFVLTARTGAEILRKTMAAGASGVASKDRGVDDILTAVGRVAVGETYADEELLRDALGLSAETSRTHAHFLASYVTPREREVLTYLVDGMTTVAISRKMDISKTTVRAHVQAILGKFGVHSRLEAVSYAIANGIVNPPT
ncbi:MAG: two-component system, NarL family, nitrate/nitrite response regulator NarL [Kribbellaceae bacterium]|nr:two-component system, NarL family, nitrate/nitrite response regulator NarL [Kribbellaceae bacterium]